VLAVNASPAATRIVDRIHCQGIIVLPLPYESIPFPLSLDASDTRADTATALLVDEALAIQRAAGGELGFFAAYRRLAELKLNHGFACDLLERGAWRARIFQHGV
jgi:hypothetical protein